MVNTNIQAPIPLSGRGLVNKPNGGYTAGEFKRCLNLESVDDQLVTRPPISPIFGGEVAAGHYQFGEILDTPVGNGFIGQSFILGSMIYATPTKMLAISGNQSEWAQKSQYLWAPTNLPVVGATGYHVIVGFFEYNKEAYWITEQYNSDAKTLTIYLYHKDADGNYTNFADLFQTMAFSQTGIDHPTNVADAIENAKFQSFFLFKERLYVVTNAGIWFSKATDPTVWNVPNGGFLRVPDTNRMCAVAIHDSIYIGTTENFYLFSYPSDPNSDGHMRVISHNEISSLCIVKDRVFASNHIEFFEVSGGNLFSLFKFEDVMDEGFHNVVLTVSENKIYFYSKSSHGNQLLYPARDEVLVFNVDLGFTSLVRFDVNVRNPAADKRTRIAAIGYYEADNITFFALEHEDSSGCSLYYQLDHNKLTYLADYGKTPFYRGLDASYNLDAQTIEYFPIPVELEIPDFTPDGSEYMMKKFRNLLMEGQLPYDGFELHVAYENGAYRKISNLLNTRQQVSATNRPPYPTRIGLNQRAKAISVLFRTPPLVNGTRLPVGNTEARFFAIIDLRLFWTYTGRSPSGIETPKTWP